MNKDVFYIVKDGEVYSPLKCHDFFRQCIGSLNCVQLRDGAKEGHLRYFSRYSKEGNIAKLEIGEVMGFLDEENKPCSREDIQNTLVFDSSISKTIEGDKLDYKTWHNIGNFSDTNLFLDEVISSNENVKKYLDTIPKFIKNGLCGGYGEAHENFVKNFYNMVVFNLLEFEKLINSNNTSFLENTLSKSDFNLSEANKLHQIIGLPKFAVSAIKDYKLDEYSIQIKALSEKIDGNSLKIFLDFLGNTKNCWTSTLVDKWTRERKMKRFFDDCNFILDESRKYKTTDFIKYILRQMMYYRDEYSFVFPWDETMYLKDYIEMCEQYGLSYEKYPPMVRRSHNLVAKNIKSLTTVNEAMEERFEEAVFTYKDVERTIEYVPDKTHPENVVEYSFIVPTCVKDIIQEGNDRHHCVGSYANKVIDGTSRVVFMRLSSEKDKSLVTLDIDKNYELIEAAKAFNEECDDIQKEVIKKWLKEIKK